MLHLLAGIDKVQVQPPSCPLGWRVFGFLKHKQKETLILISEFFVVKTLLTPILWSRKVSKSGKNDLIAFPRISQLNYKIQTFKASAETKKISTEIFSLLNKLYCHFTFFAEVKFTWVVYYRRHQKSTNQFWERKHCSFRETSGLQDLISKKAILLL